MTFLIVDDFDSMRQVTATLLRSLGAASILMASNGAEALRLLRAQPVDVILSDWNMPVMTGLELLKAVRADQRLHHLPFLMITAETSRQQIQEAIACGVSELLIKPYTAALLAERLKRALTHKARKITPAPASAATQIAPPPTAKKSERATILIVDDTPDNLHLLANLFKTEYRVQVAINGEQALGFCQSDSPPDLVLLDIMMPGMDGFEVAKRMRSHPNSENIPVIFVTAMTDDVARLQGLELGAMDFVTKPVNPDVLKPRVRNFLRYVELHKQLQADYDAMLETAHLREDVEQITRHDLKAPLAGIIGLVQTLADGSMSSAQLTQLRLVEDTALQTINMINLSSELYKIETGRFQLNAQPVQIGELLQRIIEVFRNMFAVKQLTLVVEPGPKAANQAIPQVLGDAMLCYSLFHNLLKNACEAAPENTRIWIAIDEGNPLSIRIQNQGVVPVEIRERFFEKYVTLGKPDGTGLGTYSAKLLTEAQHGRINLEVVDSKNQTTITVSLPRFMGD
ncbi:MAG: response regulator [Methylococcaceae bacterium]|nr:MAG: response regulator [Methylococcaceae bacterium]